MSNPWHKSTHVDHSTLQQVRTLPEAKIHARVNYNHMKR